MAIQFQTVAPKATYQESIFRSVIHGVTSTITSTSTNYPALRLGEPVIISTATIGVGALGQEVVRAVTCTAVIDRLCVGPVASDTIALEGSGLVQVYGVATVRLSEAATVAAGDKLLPTVNTTATALASYGIGAWVARTITDTDLHSAAGVHAVVVAPATAVSGTNSYTNGYAMIRAM